MAPETNFESAFFNSFLTKLLFVINEHNHDVLCQMSLK